MDSPSSIQLDNEMKGPSAVAKTLETTPTRKPVVKGDAGSPLERHGPGITLREREEGVAAASVAKVWRNRK